MSFTAAADLVYAFRFLKLLTTRWEDTKAFELGLIDANGKSLKRATSREEKNAYTLFQRLVFNIKRLISKVPGGKTSIASYAAALYLIKEHTGLPEAKIQQILEKAGYQPDDTTLLEGWVIRDEVLLPGRYQLTEDILSPTTGEVIGRSGTSVYVPEDCMPVDKMFNAYIYEVKHVNTEQMIYVTAGDIVR